MFGIGSTELLVILVVALLVLGPKNLPKIAHTLGRAMGEFRRVSTEFQRTLNTEIAFEEEAEKAKAKKAAANSEKTTSGTTGSPVSDTENKA
ncbi:Sec-independent protein translocase protein TatB [uncultured Mailhella sp.]|uniref:Sec-independent protein translocase protein TatB n=1 Tax=uncultured Mailhella sp. TaxID=1981031 RepID=UPI0025E0ED9D|nr:Sec-independent protein translocase protein TatB [uncultured Mailhella sp.]